MRSRTAAVGVGFLLNSTSSVISWSWVALCRFWFFCCCVKVLFRVGRLADKCAEEGAVVDVGDGVVMASGVPTAMSNSDMSELLKSTLKSMASYDVFE